MAINNYPGCKHIQRPIPELKVTKEISDAIAEDFRTLPVFEKGLYDITYTKHYSLQTNVYLKCRWTEFKNHYRDRNTAPVFINDQIRNYHFHNCKNRLMPSQSIADKGDFRMKMRPGPGMDSQGQIPIPYTQDRGLPKENCRNRNQKDHRESNLNADTEKIKSNKYK